MMGNHLILFSTFCSSPINCFRPLLAVTRLPLYRPSSGEVYHSFLSVFRAVSWSMSLFPSPAHLTELQQVIFLLAFGLGRKLACVTISLWLLWVNEPLAWNVRQIRRLILVPLKAEWLSDFVTFWVSHCLQLSILNYTVFFLLRGQCLL